MKLYNQFLCREACQSHQPQICQFVEENVRKYVEELLEAMAAAAGVEERERTLQAAATGLKTSLVDPEKVHVAVNGRRCQANLVCIICWAVEHTRMTVRFVKVFLRLKSSSWNDPKRWHVGHVNQAVCMKLFWLLHWNLRRHRDCCPCHWYFPLIAWLVEYWWPIVGSRPIVSDMILLQVQWFGSTAIVRPEKYQLGAILTSDQTMSIEVPWNSAACALMGFEDADDMIDIMWGLLWLFSACVRTWSFPPCHSPPSTAPRWIIQSQQSCSRNLMLGLVAVG